MNILHIASNYPPEIGGPAASVPYLAEEQVKSGHNVIILTHGLPLYTENKKIKIYRCGRIDGEISSITCGIKKSVKMAILGRKIIKEHKIDIIHAHDPNISTITKIMIDPYNKIPSVVKYSGDLAWEILGLKSEKYIKNPDEFWTTISAKSIYLIERLMFSRFNKIIAQSKYQKMILEKYLKVKQKKIEIIPNGIKKYKYTKKELASVEKEHPRGVTVCSVSRLVPWKGVDDVIKAMKEIDAKYLIFGDGPYKNQLERFSKEENLSGKIIFFGKIPHEKVQLHLKCCNLLIVPSRYEPFGITILDGFAADIPVIASNTGGIPELIDACCLFENRNITNIIEIIKYAQKNREYIRQMQKEKLRDFSWKNISKKTEECYFKILTSQT